MKVFLCESIHPKAYEALAQKAEIISDWERAGEVDALLDRILYIGKEQLDKMPNLKVIAVHGTGTDGLDWSSLKLVFQAGDTSWYLIGMVHGQWTI